MPGNCSRARACGGGLEQIPAVQDILRDVLKVPNPARATPEETSRAMRLLYSTYHSPVHRIESELTGVPRLEGGLEQVTQGLVGRQERGLLGDRKSVVEGK